MAYVVDTSSFVVLKNYYPGTFATLWANIDALVASGALVSVREVSNELQNYNDVDFVQGWAKTNKAIFKVPSSAQQLNVQKILAVPHFQTLISGKAVLAGTPVADPFVIAAGMELGATVVTEELFKPNAAKIPNVCQHFGVPCLNLEGLMKAEGWTF